MGFSQNATFKQFENLLRDILIVTFSETENVNLNDSCFNAQKRLIENIKSLDEREFIEKIDTIEKEINEIYGNSEDEPVMDLDFEATEFNVTGKLSTFLQKLEENCKTVAQTGERPNPYWCPNFANNLLRICKHFTLWTCTKWYDCNFFTKRGIFP